MSIGTSRTIHYGNAKGGAYFAPLKADVLVGATTIDIIGSGGPLFGAAVVEVGQKVYFIKTGKLETRSVTAVVIDGGTSDATLTLDSALTFAHSKDEEVCVTASAPKATLLSAFSSTRNMNNWSSEGYFGSRSKNTGRKRGRIEASGSAEFKLRPDVNVAFLVKAVGQDTNVTGTNPTTGQITSTLSADVAKGDTTFTSAGAFLVGNIVQFGTGATAECRKVTATGASFTVDVAFDYAHASAGAVKTVVAPFKHYIPSAPNKLDKLVMVDFIPMEDETSADGMATHSYFLPGALMKGFTAESQTEQGISISIDYECQDKVVIAKDPEIAIPDEDEYTFDEEIVLFDDVRNYLCTEISIQADNDPQKRFTKNGQFRASKIEAGQQEVTGSLKFAENSQTQQYFWQRLEESTPLKLEWKIVDRATGYYTSLLLPKVVIDEVNDGDFGPADLVDMEVPFTAINDNGATNVQLILEIGNGEYLPY